jgi:hypothetical protein
MTAARSHASPLSTDAWSLASRSPRSHWRTKLLCGENKVLKMQLKFATQLKSGERKKWTSFINQLLKQPISITSLGSRLNARPEKAERCRKSVSANNRGVERSMLCFHNALMRRKMTDAGFYTEVVGSTPAFDYQFAETCWAF